MDLRTNPGTVLILVYFGSNTKGDSECEISNFSDFHIRDFICMRHKEMDFSTISFKDILNTECSNPGWASEGERSEFKFLVWVKFQTYCSLHFL